MLPQFFFIIVSGLERRVKKTRLEWRVFSGRRDSELKKDKQEKNAFYEYKSIER